MRIYTRKGDTGTTGLLFGGDRVSKATLRTDAYGTTDEAVSALGLARASIGSQTDRTEVRLAELCLRLQRSTTRNLRSRERVSGLRRASTPQPTLDMPPIAVEPPANVPIPAQFASRGVPARNLRGGRTLRADMGPGVWVSRLERAATAPARRGRAEAPSDRRAASP